MPLYREIYITIQFVKNLTYLTERFVFNLATCLVHKKSLFCILNVVREGSFQSFMR